MNIYDVFKKGGVTVNNPNWTKKNSNIEPRTIVAPATERNSGSIYGDMVNPQTGGSHLYLDPNAAKRAKQLQEYGLTLNTDDDKAIELQLADAQSNWNKLWHGVTQTFVNELGLGSVRAFSDLADFTIGGAIRLATGEENDYTNPVSETIKRWQEAFEEAQPIYRDTSLNIGNGGFFDVGWWTSNMPSIASSLTLLLPSTGVAKGLNFLGKATTFNKGVGNVRRFLTAIDKVDKAAETAAKTGKELNNLQRFSQFLNNENTVRVVNNMVETGVNGFTSRILENYQESNQVYQDLLPEITQSINEMNEAEYAAFIDRNKDVLKGINTDNKADVAKRIAKEGADTTFRDDMANGFFDVLQIYGLRNLKRFMNNPMSASVRRAHLNSIKYARARAKGEDIEKLLKDRSRFTKALESTRDFLWGSKVVIGSELSEGVEEAINYIAQEEGMRYGHILLGTQDNNTNFWDTRLRDYLLNPQLYDAAFWGVLGGVVFQAGGTKLAQARKAYNIKKDERNRKPDKTTQESVEKTPWSDAFRLDEVQAMLDNIDARSKADITLKEQLEKISRDINPFETNPDGTNITLKTEEERFIARNRAWQQREDNLLRNAMFCGNWDITRAYLESDEVRDALVDAGIVSAEEAKARQEEAKRRADRMETLYSESLRAVGNAMRGKDPETGVNFSETPAEYFQIIAAENMQHQLNAEQYDENIKKYQPLVGSEEHRLAKELEESGINYKETIRNFIIAQQLAQIEAELDAAQKTTKDGKSENDIDARTISGQTAIRELKTRKNALINLLRESVQGANINSPTTANKAITEGAKLLVTLRAAASAEKLPTGEYRTNTNSERYKKVDAAIVNAFNSDESNWLESRTALTSLVPEFGNYTLDQFKEAAKQADVINEQINAAVGENGAIEKLDALSHNLLTAYSAITYNEIARELELSQVAKDRERIRTLAHFKHNQQQALRHVALKTALYSIKAIAKKYYEETGDISRELAYGTINEESRNKLKEILSDDDLRTYDDAMKIIALNRRSVTKNNNKETSAINSLLPEIIQDAIYESSRDEFEEISDKPVTEDDTKTEENSTISENSKLDTQNQKVDNPSQKESKTTTEQKEQTKIDFHIRKNGIRRESQVASISVNDDNAPIKLNQFASNHEDYVDCMLLPVEGEEDTYELDFKDELASEAKDGSEPVFNNPQFFSVKTPFIDGGVITVNPKVTVNDDGTIAEFLPGIIDKASNAEVDSSSSNSSSTGGEIKTEKQDGEVDASTFNEDDPVDDVVVSEPYDDENLNTDVSQEMMLFAKEMKDNSGQYDENVLYNRLREKFKNKVSEEELAKAFNFLRRFGRNYASRQKLGIKEFDNLSDFIDASALSDAAVGEDMASKAHKALEKAFNKVLDDFIKNSVVDEHKGKKVISLENLLRYTNEVAGDNTMGQLLYDKFVDLLKDNDNYVILERKQLDYKNSIIDRASMSEEERFDVSNSPNGRTIDLNYLIKRNKLSKEEREKLYDILDSLQPNDELEYETVDSGRGVEIRKKGFAIGRLYVPKVTSSHFEGISTGWIVDIPRSNDGTTSKLEQLFIRFMINPNNESNVTPILDAIREAAFTPRQIRNEDKEKVDNPKFTEAKQAVLDAIDASGINITEYIDLNKDDRLDLVNSLLTIYRGVKSASDQILAKRGMSRKEFEGYISERRKASIHNWFERLKDSYSTAVNLAGNKNLKIKVDTVNQGGLIITAPDEARPINEEGVIGSNHKGKIEIVASSISEIGTLYSTSGVSIPFGGFRPASTFISIPKANGELAYVHAFPQLISSPQAGNDVKEIRNEVLAEFDRLLSEWSDNTFMSASKIADFINTLCSAQNKNNALFKGFEVSRLTNNYEGYQITYKKGNRVHYIKLFDGNKYGKASVIRFDKEDATAFREPTKRKEVLKKFRDIVDETLKYNLEFDYIRGTRTLKGFAKRRNGKFVIEIPNGKTHVFKSFKDFIIDNGLVAVTTKSTNGKTNFYGIGESTSQFDKPRVTFKVLDNITPHVKGKEIKPTPVTTRKGDTIKTLIQNSGNSETIGSDIINLVLNDTQLKSLKNSTMYKELSFGNIIFVDKLNNNIAAHFEKAKRIGDIIIPANTIVVTQKWIDLLNSSNISEHEEAIRHLIHESIHRKIDTLSKKEQENLFNNLRNIFDEFVAANEKDIPNGSIRKFEYNDTAANRRKYYKNGEINTKGLEEFLVESITRPALIERLNSISTDGKKITNQKLGATKSKNLLQSILATIAKLFNLNINKGSLLEKEYKLFAQVGLTTKETNTNNREIESNQKENSTSGNVSETSSQEQQNDSSQEQQTNNENTVQRTEPISVETPEKKLNIKINRNLIDESSISDKEVNNKEVASLGQVRDTIIPENRETFENLVSKGAIQINC